MLENMCYSRFDQPSFGDAIFNHNGHFSNVNLSESNSFRWAGKNEALFDNSCSTLSENRIRLTS